MTYVQSNVIRIVTAFICGLLFGAGLIISGMVNPIKVTAFLDISGKWDPSLAFVMGGALMVFFPIFHLVIKPRKTALNGDEINIRTNRPIDVRLISGAAIFGIGWGLAGYCPGPVVTSLAGGSPTIIVFALSMVAGMQLARVYTNNTGVTTNNIQANLAVEEIEGA